MQDFRTLPSPPLEESFRAAKPRAPGRFGELADAASGRDERKDSGGRSRVPGALRGGSSRSREGTGRRVGVRAPRGVERCFCLQKP